MIVTVPLKRDGVFRLGMNEDTKIMHEIETLPARLYCYSPAYVNEELKT